MSSFDNGTCQRNCFHCGLAVPGGTAFGHAAAGGWRAFCRLGCEAVSRSISGLGLDDYYRLRVAAAPRPDAGDPDDLASFDDPLVQSRFVAKFALAEGERREARLLVEGLRCAACAGV